MFKEPGEMEEHRALLYHAHHRTHLDDIPFWLEMAARQGGPILELGCGTGRTLIPIAQAGYHIFGLDNDFRMLEVLRQNVPSGVIQYLNNFLADAAIFNLAVQFPLVMMPCNTFSTFTEQRRQAMLSTIRKHLRSGGAFVACVPNPETLEELGIYGEPEVEEVFMHPITGHPVQVVTKWDRAGQEFNLDWYYDHLLPDGLVHRLAFRTSHQIVHVDRYEDEFSRAGIKLHKVFGDFDFAEYELDSPHLILWGIKR